MHRFVLAFAFVSSLMAASYTLAPAAAPPADVPAAIGALLNPAGHKITGPDGKVWCEIWFVKQSPSGPETTEVDVTWKTIPPGSVIGAIHFPNGGSDRRAQPIEPGFYTLRFSMFPINGDHQGVAPQRDFLVMSPVAIDQSAERVPKFEDLMNLSRKASGNPHPAVLSMWLVESDFKPGLQQLGEHDWALFATVGGANISLIVAGKAEG
jgi:hypothetical protein